MDKKNRSMKIKVKENGPYVVTGGIPLSDQILILDEDCLATGYREGKRYPLQEEYELCRCGKSNDKPFCDGAHHDFEFFGNETASRKPFMEQAEPPTIGADMDLYDVVPLCANARFCDRAGGAWDNTRASDDPEAKKIALQEVFDCPAGRLVLKDKAGNDIEPEFEPSIVLVYDPVVNVFGPIWVRGGIPVEAADGKLYEVRNRVTLCRCGKSDNKPFCDGKHVEGE
jgi:CDGSH-type Zn-finger protein